jgi:hypothetical protein
MPLLHIVFLSSRSGLGTGGIAAAANNERLVQTQGQARRNVYYAIFDSYPGREVTDKYFHIDNRDIGNFLARNGFSARAISSRTILRLT